MPTQTIAANDPRVKSTTSMATLALPHPVLLGLASGVMLWLSFPPAEWSWSAWFALVPLFLLVVSGRSKQSVYLGSWVGGFAFWLLAIHWIWWTDETAWLGWVAMSLFLSIWWPMFVFTARFAQRRLQLPLIVAAPVLWVALEYVRAYVLTGFPWYYLAHSQYRILYFTQIADFAGALGLSFLIATVNAYWVDLLTLPLFRRKASGSWWARLAPTQRVRLIAVGLGVLGTLGYGAFRVSTANFRAGPRIAMLQSSEVNTYNSDHKRSREAIQADIESLVRMALASSPRPDLIVWPETANPWGFVTIDPKLDMKVLDKQVKEIDPEYIAADWTLKRDRVTAYLASLMDSARVPMVIGTSIHDFRSSGYSRFNAAILFQPGLPIQVYEKMHLVPFGEYVPLLNSLPWLIRLTPYRDTKVHFLDHGPGPSWFEFGKLRLAAAICFEDTVPQVTRRFFAEAPDGRQPDILVNLSNDGWFHQTSEHEMHLAVSVFRCIENRVPLVRAVNTGISAMVDGNGKILASLAKLKRGVLVENTPLDDRVSFYSTWGDWLGLFCVASTIGLLILGTFSPRGRATSSFQTA